MQTRNSKISKFGIASSPAISVVPSRYRRALLGPVVAIACLAPACGAGDGVDPNASEQAARVDGPIARSAAALTGPTTFLPEEFPNCSGIRFTVPDGVRYMRVAATGGSGYGGVGYDDGAAVRHRGGNGGAGALVTAVVATTPGSHLLVNVAHNGGDESIDKYRSFGAGGYTNFHYGSAGGASFVSFEPEPRPVCYEYRDTVLVVAGGGGGGGGAEVGGAGGDGGNAGSADFSGGNGVTGTGGGCGKGGGGGGGTVSANGAGGKAGCLLVDDGAGGVLEIGGANPITDALGSGGAGGGGYFGGGAGGNGLVGAGGGGAGSSFVTASALAKSVAVDSTHAPKVVLTPLYPPATTITLTGPGQQSDWFTGTVTVTVTAADQDGGTVAKSYYAVDKATCTPSALSQCTLYSGPISIATEGVHTITSFSVDNEGFVELPVTRTFVLVHVAAGASVSSGALSTAGTNPTVITGGTVVGSTGTVSVTGTGTGVVGVAKYDSDPATVASFATGGGRDAFFDVIVPAGSALTRVVIKVCPGNGDTTANWFNGTAWVPASVQAYNRSTKCIDVQVDATTSPSIAQLRGTVFGLGHAPEVTAIAKTADGNPYVAGTWTNQAVTVSFLCDAPANARVLSPPKTVSAEGANQSVTGTCTDGVGGSGSATFAGIFIDKTPPVVTCSVSPNRIWPPNGAMIPVAATVKVSDAASGPRSDFTLVSVTSSEADPGAIAGFTVGAKSTTGTVRAKRLGTGSDRVYSLTYRGKDVAGNAAQCTTTVTVPHAN